MEIPKIELVSKNSNGNYISTENIFGSSFGLEASELSFESRLSLDLKSKEPAGDGETDDTRESVSTLRLSIGCHELNISAQESEVYFQKITASVVFSEDYKCKIRKKKCESDCHITNIFGEKDEKYAKLIAEAKKRQRCGPCLTRNECNCGDTNVLPVIETRISARPKVVETFMAKPSSPKPNKMNTKVRRKTGKLKKKLEKSGKEGEVDQSKNDEENDDESLNSVLEEYKKALDEGLLRRDSMIVTRERISAILEKPVVENLSQNDLEEEIYFDPNSRKVSMSPAPPQIIPEEVPDPKTTSFRVRLKSKPRSCTAQCQKPNIPTSNTEFQKVRKKRSKRLCGCNTSRENRRKVVRDVASCMPTQNSREISTNTHSMPTTMNCKSTQTCCEDKRRPTDPKPRTICRSIGIDPIDEIDGCDRAKLWIVLDELIQEFEKQYEEETRRCTRKKRKRQCFCKDSRTDRRKQTCTYAYLTMTKPYMQYDTRLPLKKSYIKYAIENNNSIRCEQNKNLLKFLSLKQKEITCFRCDLKRDVALTEDDAQRFNKEFCDFLVQNGSR